MVGNGKLRRKGKTMKAKTTVFACIIAAIIMAVPLAGCSTSSAPSSNAASTTASSSAATQVSSSSTAADLADVQYTMYVGTNDKDTNQPVYPPEESKQRAKAILMKYFGGYTIQEADGGWRGDDGTEYQEYTLVIHLSDTDLDAVHKAAKEMLDEFHQSSILINTDTVTTEFYGE